MRCSRASETKKRLQVVLRPPAIRSPVLLLGCEQSVVRVISAAPTVRQTTPSAKIIRAACNAADLCLRSAQSGNQQQASSVADLARTVLSAP
jgi:hypothetical protein